MLRNVFTKRLRDARGGVIGWGLALAALVALTVFSYPAVRDMPALNELIEGLPDAIIALIGEEDLVSPAGYLNSQLFTIMVPLIVAIYGIVAGAGAIAGEEERGRLDLLLANPLPRWRVGLASFGALALVLALLAGLVSALLLLTGPLVELDVPADRIVAIGLHAAAYGICFAAIAYGIGSATGSRGLALGIAAVVALATYFVHALAPLVDVFESLDGFSPFAWYIRADPLRNGADAGDLGLLVAVAAAAVALGTLAFERRDVAI